MALSLLAGTALMAQPSPLTERVQAAPPEIEEALRDRVKQFFDLQAEGKFRQAEALVAEDSKDRYYSMDKDRAEGVDVVKIVWEENFTKARVVISRMVRMVVPMAPSGVKIKGVFTTYWKLEKSAWYWYLPPEPEWIDTPFGKMRNSHYAGADQKPSSPADLDEANKKATERASAITQSIYAGVKVDRSQLRFSAAKASEEAVTIHNGLPGPISLRVAGAAIAGLTARLEKADLNANESTRLVVTYKPGDGANPPAAAELRLEVEPMRQSIPVALQFAPAPTAK
jgi:hypothetical protein